MLLVSSRITDEFAAVLRGATTARGYTSNVGASVRIGQLRGAAEEAPSCYLVPGRQSPGEARFAHRRLVVRGYEIRGFIDMNDHSTLSDHEAVDLVVWDIRRCVESGRGPLADLVERIAYSGDRPGYREDGGTIVGAAIEYDVVYHVDLLQPDIAL